MANLFSVKDKVVVITGGTGVLGKAIAAHLAEEGAKVILLGRKTEVGNKIVESIRTQGGEALFLTTDVLDRKILEQNLADILTPSKAKKDTAVDIREEHGEKYSPVLTPRNEARDVTLHFALYNKTQAGWMKQYFAFVNFLKQGKDGWLEIRFPQLDLQLRVKYADCTKFTPLTYLWTEGVHAGKFRVKFREPKPII